MPPGNGWKAPTKSPVPGYDARMFEHHRRRGDHWFRPDDICVAPDGAVYVADWYDPGVGGHATGDMA